MINNNFNNNKTLVFLAGESHDDFLTINLVLDQISILLKQGVSENDICLCVENDDSQINWTENYKINPHMKKHLKRLKIDFDGKKVETLSSPREIDIKSECEEILKSIKITGIDTFKPKEGGQSESGMRKRNKAMAQNIEKIAKNFKYVFVLVGSYHVIQNDGLYKLLKEVNNITVFPFIPFRSDLKNELESDYCYRIHSERLFVKDLYPSNLDVSQFEKNLTKEERNDIIYITGGSEKKDAFGKALNEKLLKSLSRKEENTRSCCDIY